MTKISVVNGDKGYDINFTLEDANEVAFDLTGSTLLFKAQKQGDADLKFSGNMAIIDGPAGTCKYTVQEGDFSQPGAYYAEIEASFGGSKVVTFSDIVVEVKPQLPR